MAKESVWQRRARKRGSTKADYYPKVDLAGRSDGIEALAELEAAPPIEVKTEAAPVVDEIAPASFELAQAPEADEDERDLNASGGESLLDAPKDLVAAPVTTGTERPAAGSPLRLPAFLDLPAARPLAQALLERRGQPIVIDGSAVQQLGAQCVQVLLSAKRTWSADQASLSLINCAPRMIEDLHLLGIDPAALIHGDLPQ